GAAQGVLHRAADIDLPPTVCRKSPDSGSAVEVAHALQAVVPALENVVGVVVFTRIEMGNASADAQVDCMPIGVQPIGSKRNPVVVSNVDPGCGYHVGFVAALVRGTHGGTDPEGHIPWAGG